MSIATATRTTAAATPAPSTQIATVGEASAPSKLPSIGEQLKAREHQFKAVLPAHIPLERFLRVVMTAIQRNPQLAFADRTSLLTSSVTAAQDGLLPDGREGALVIYRSKDKDENGRDVWIDKVQWMPMIAGIRKKVRNSGEIATWETSVVHANDQFEFELGDDPYIKHRPKLDGDPGAVVAAYSIATLKSGEKSRELMTKAQIEAVRARSKQKDKDGNPTGPWQTDYAEMCRKTVARRHSKVLPMSTDLDDLMRRDDELYDMKGAREAALAANGGKPQSLASRLDALAGAAGREDAPIVERQEIEHDPETGVIDEGRADTGDGNAPENDKAGAGQPASAAGGDAIVNPKRVALLEKMRPKAGKGTAALRRGFAALAEGEADVLLDSDHEELGAIAEKADEAAGRGT